MIRIDGDINLPESLRDELRKPFGRLMESAGVAALLKDSPAKSLVTIGDSISLSLINAGIKPSLIIWDGKTGRAPCNDSAIRTLKAYAPAKRASNPAGGITKGAWDIVTSALHEKRASIFIDGEEDLLAIPAILNSDDGTTIVYGLPGKGAILIVVDRKIKAVFQDILSRFQKL